MAKPEMEAAIKQLGIEMQCTFIPFSQSRNKDSKTKSLNWKVSLLRNGKPFITTDYMAGIAHCPSYKHKDNYERHKLIQYECEHGKVGRYLNSISHISSISGRLILPDICDVMHSLISDANAIDYATFEEWATSLGYDPDSRKAEAIYRACLETGLRLRSGLGSEGIQLLEKAAQDY